MIGITLAAAGDDTRLRGPDQPARDVLAQLEESHKIIRPVPRAPRAHGRRRRRAADRCYADAARPTSRGPASRRRRHGDRRQRGRATLPTLLERGRHAVGSATVGRSCGATRLRQPGRPSTLAARGAPGHGPDGLVPPRRDTRMGRVPRREDLRHHPARGRRAGGVARRLGDRLHPLAAAPSARPIPAVAAGIARTHAPPGRARRRVRQPGARRGRRAPTRRSGSRTCSCTATRARPSAPPSPSAPAPRVIKAAAHRLAGRHAATPSASTPTSTCSTPTPARVRRHGPHVELGAGRRSAARRSPLILSGGLTPENVAEAIAAVHPWGSTSPRASRPRPAIKDPAKVEAFIAAAQEAAPVPHDARRRSSTASAPTAASTCPRR